MPQGRVFWEVSIKQQAAPVGGVLKRGTQLGKVLFEKNSMRHNE